MEKPLAGHEFAHGATREIYCGGQGRKARRGCSYRGQHDKRFYKVLRAVHRKLKTPKPHAKMLESKAGYNPPPDFLDYASSRGSTKKVHRAMKSRSSNRVKRRQDPLIRCIHAMVRAGYSPRRAVSKCGSAHGILGSHIDPTLPVRVRKGARPYAHAKRRGRKPILDRIVSDVADFATNLFRPKKTKRRRSRRGYRSTEIRGRSFADFQVRLARILENKYGLTRGSAFAIAHGNRAMDGFRRGYSPQFVASMVAYRKAA